MDKRTLKTRKAIYDAFSTLLMSKNYSRISIKEIIDLADIGRSTFYSHFETKDELLKSFCISIFEKMESEERTFDLVSFNSFITAMFHHILINKKIITGILSSNSSDYIITYLTKYFRGHLHDIISNYPVSDLISEDFLLNHIIGSFFVAVKWWSQNQFKQSPEELAKHYIAVISPLLPQLF